MQMIEHKYLIMIVYIHKCSSLKILSHDSLYSIWLTSLVQSFVNHMWCIVPLLIIQGPLALVSSRVGSLRCNFSAWQLTWHEVLKVTYQMKWTSCMTWHQHNFTELRKTPSPLFMSCNEIQLDPLKWIESFKFTATNTFPPRFSNLLFFLPSNVQKVH